MPTSRQPTTRKETTDVTLHLELVPILSIAAGIAILVVPRSMKYIIGGYLIVVGVIQLIQ